MVLTNPFLSVPGRSVRGMNLNMGGITIDCVRPRELAGFWTEALDLTVAFDADGEYLQLRSRAGSAPLYLGLQKVPEDKAGKNRVHLDLATDDPETEIARLVALGAVAGESHEIPGLAWTVLRDPEGNEFCVGSPHG
jgi:predicted enzyme related to lactoylglutathione lyase